MPLRTSSLRVSSPSLNSQDFLHALPPILTDALGEDAERFTASYLEIDQYIFARAEGAAAAAAASPGGAAPALPPKGKVNISGRGQASGRGQTSGRGQQVSGRGQQPPAESDEPDRISAAARQRIIAAALRHVTSLGGENVELRVTQAGALTALNTNFRGGSDSVDGVTAEVIKSKLDSTGAASSSNSGATGGKEEETVQAMTSAAAGAQSRGAGGATRCFPAGAALSPQSSVRRIRSPPLAEGRGPFLSSPFLFPCRRRRPAVGGQGEEDHGPSEAHAGPHQQRQLPAQPAGALAHRERDRHAHLVQGWRVRCVFRGS